MKEVSTDSGFVKIAQVVVGVGGLSSITFSSIPASCTDLHITALARSTASQGYCYYYAQFNGDTGSNYGNLWDQFGNSGGSSGVLNSQTKIILGLGIGDTATAGRAGVLKVHIPGYSNTTFHKGVLSNSTRLDASTNMFYYNTAGIWYNTAAITSINIAPDTGNWKQGSVFTLYAST